MRTTGIESLQSGILTGEVEDSLKDQYIGLMLGVIEDRRRG